MAQKTVLVPDLGEITLSKRRGARNLRLSITPAGKVRVSLPVWLPYSAGIAFARQRREWITKHLKSDVKKPLSHGSRVGKSYRLDYSYNPAVKTVSARVGNGVVSISAPWPLSHTKVQAKAVKAAEKALKKEAETLLPARLSSLARQKGYTYKSLRVRRLTSRWGSCSSQGEITLNYFLMQLPWPLIDYVILHELVHTRHLNHGRGFWDEFEKSYPGAKNFRRQLKDHRPILNAIASTGEMS